MAACPSSAAGLTNTNKLEEEAPRAGLSLSLPEETVRRLVGRKRRAEDADDDDDEQEEGAPMPQLSDSDVAYNLLNRYNTVSSHGHGILLEFSQTLYANGAPPPITHAPLSYISLETPGPAHPAVHIESETYNASVSVMFYQAFSALQIDLPPAVTRQDTYTEMVNFIDVCHCHQLAFSCLNSLVLVDHPSLVYLDEHLQQRRRHLLLIYLIADIDHSSPTACQHSSHRIDQQRHGAVRSSSGSCHAY